MELLYWAELLYKSPDLVFSRHFHIVIFSHRGDWNLLAHEYEQLLSTDQIPAEAVWRAISPGLPEGIMGIRRRLSLFS